MQITVKLKANEQEPGFVSWRMVFYGFHCEEVQRLVVTGKIKLKQLKKGRLTIAEKRP